MSAGAASFALRLTRWLHATLQRRIAQRRPPDFVIRPTGQDYLRRWWVIPRNPLLNIYLHQILQSDDDRALHCHPWANVSIILAGGYTECLPRDQRQPSALDYAPHGQVKRRRSAGTLTARWGHTRHRLVIEDGAAPCWTLFITGPVYRRWGFWCTHGWRWWREYVDDADRGTTGRGCA